MSKFIFRYLPCLFLLSAGLLNIPSAYAAITTAGISAATMKAVPNCLHLKVTGFCTWFSPVVGYNTTPYVEHYLPDLVVSTFSQDDNDAWSGVAATLDKAGKSAQQAIVHGFSGFDANTGQHSLQSPTEQAVYFYQTDIVGNPALTLIAAKGNPFILPSTAIPGLPYFQSMLDAGVWRGFPQLGALEEGYAIIANPFHHVGTGLINWGGIYPHEGKVASGNAAKAAAVIAQRAADILTSTMPFTQIHVHFPLSPVCGQKCQASPVQENNLHTQFQMVYPVQENTCVPLGQSATFGEGDNLETQANGAYIWVVWRFYQGCRDGIGQFVSVTKYSHSDEEHAHA